MIRNWDAVMPCVQEGGNSCAAAMAVSFGFAPASPVPSLGGSWVQPGRADLTAPGLSRLLPQIGNSCGWTWSPLAGKSLGFRCGLVGPCKLRCNAGFPVPSVSQVMVVKSGNRRAPSPSSRPVPRDMLFAANPFFPSLRPDKGGAGRAMETKILCSRLGPLSRRQ